MGPMVNSIIALAIVWFILNKTKIGFHAFAIGGNEEVARLAGIPVNRNKIIYYCISGFMAALSSMVTCPAMLTPLASTVLLPTTQLWAM